MAYNIYVYARPDSGIERTRVLRSDTSTAEYIYKGSGNNDWYMTTIENVTGVVEFYAEADSGYVFSEFVYRIGSDSATQQYSNENPFEYFGDEDIFIRAIGEEGSPTIHIDEFDWNTSNGSATAVQTRKAYETLILKSKVKDFSHLVWNDMVDKLNEVIEAEGNNWNPQYESLEKTKMTSTDRTMTAVRFNSFCSNMVGYGLEGWTLVKRRDPVKVLALLQLIEMLNSYIRNNHQ